MNTFDVHPRELKDLLTDVVKGKIQLPEFQRGWVWDDEHIRDLLVSIARSFPIGAVMLLETGGDVRFQARLVEGVKANSGQQAERLILDGQQRLTSLTQALMLNAPVTTRDEKKNEVKLFYYFDIDHALADPTHLEEAIVAVGEDRISRKNFGRDVALDLSTAYKEYSSFFFPCNQLLNHTDWFLGLHTACPDRVAKYTQFLKQVIQPFAAYDLPVIELKNGISKEAVCLVFDKVNSGGVRLTVFELVTAMYAANNFNLRTDWYGDKSKKGRHQNFATEPLLKEMAPTDFLQGLTLLYTFEQRQTDLREGKTGKNVTGVSAKRESILETPLSAYRQWADKLTTGFIEARKFLVHLGFDDPKFLPYRAQVTPLAATLTHIGNRWLEPQVQKKLSRWYWSGVFGELYGSASESRIAVDFQSLMTWIHDAAAPEPATVTGAGFQASRLDTMRTRTSAAYRGLYVLLQGQGAEDFFWKARISQLERIDKGIDIHHIFPRKWCEEHGVLPAVYDSIINKTAISYRANRKIGGKAPSEYLKQIENDVNVQLLPAEMDRILQTHLTSPALLRSDDFVAFMIDRKSRLLALVENAMGKAAEAYTGPPASLAAFPDEEVTDEDDEAGDIEGLSASSEIDEAVLEHSLSIAPVSGTEMLREIRWLESDRSDHGHGVQFLHHEVEPEQPYGGCVAFLEGYGWMRGGPATVELLSICPPSINAGRWTEILQSAREAVTMFLSDDRNANSEFNYGPISIVFNA